MEHNIAGVVVAGLAADGHRKDGYRSDFTVGAKVLLRALVKLGSERSSSQQYAVESAYMAAIGTMAMRGEDGTVDATPEVWTTVVTQLQGPDREWVHATEMLSGLLLLGTYEAESSRSTAAAMRDAVQVALGRTSGVEDDFSRRRQARAWINAGRAALGAGDDALANAISATIADDVRPWPRGPIADDSDHLYDATFMTGRPVAQPELPDTHTQPDVMAAFEALLLEHRRDVPGDASDESPRSKAPRSQGLDGTSGERGATGSPPS